MNIIDIDFTIQIIIHFILYLLFRYSTINFILFFIMIEPNLKFSKSIA
jgi:hypothetical protein